MTYDQAARQLNWPAATVKSRLTRGRLRLRERLSRAVSRPPRRAWPRPSPACSGPRFPETLVHSTIRAASSRHAGAVPAAVSKLTEEVLKIMVLEKLRWVAAGIVILISLGVAALAQQSSQERVARPDSRKAEVNPPNGRTKSPQPIRDGSGLSASGAAVEVIGVSPHPSGPETWWGPDGKPLAQPPCDRVSTRLSSTDPTISRAIVVRTTGLPAGAEHNWWIDEAQGGSGPQARLGGLPVPGLEEAIALFDHDQATGTVRFKVAAGAWKTVQTWGTSPGSRGDRDGTSYIFSVPIETRKGTVLSVTHNIKDDSVRLVAVDLNGKEHPADPRSSSGAWEMRQTVGEFDLSPQEIKQFRVQTRSFEEVTVPGIALNPAKAN